MTSDPNNPSSTVPEPLFFDDFCNTELDRSNWNVEVTGEIVNNEQQAYIDSPETIYIEPESSDGAQGVLVIQPRFRPGYLTPQGDAFDLVSGRIHTRSKVEFSQANIAARIALPSASGVWAAFWVMGMGTPWPQCGEIDIMENVGEPDWTSAALHGPGYSGETPLVNKYFFPATADATHWHVYSLEWTPEGGMNFRIDGALFYRVTRPMVEFYGPWAFESQQYLILNCALGGTYPFKTNGVRSPYYGIPQATLEAIQKREIKYRVDWVKITRP